MEKSRRQILRRIPLKNVVCAQTRHLEIVENAPKMSEAEHIGVLDSGQKITPEDIRELTGAVTPHFAQQVRVRVGRLISGLDASDPARVFGEREMARLEDLAHHSGQPGSESAH